MKTNQIRVNNNEFLSYCQIKSSKNTDFGILFFGGLKSDMSGTKATYIQNYCKNNDLDFTKFDYFGHGKSSGDFEDGTIERWLENCLYIIDNIINKPQIIIGSSMGGWLMILAGLIRPNKVKSLLGIASAPDFTETIHDNATHVSKKLIINAKNHLVLNKPTININKPTILLHGMSDEIVTYTNSITIADKLESDNVKIELVKNADHRFSSPECLELISNSISTLISEAPHD